MKVPVRFRVNGCAVSTDCEPRTTLADCLRHDVRLTGTHIGCEHGVCGACTVIVDGAAVRSCLMLAVQAHGSEVMTVEEVSTAYCAHAKRRGRKPTTIGNVESETRTHLTPFFAANRSTASGPRTFST